MTRKILSIAAAVGAIAAAIGVVVVAAAFAVYALMRTWLGEAASAAVVAAVFALIAVIVALVAFGRASPRGLRQQPPPSPVDQAFGLVQQKPLLALGAVAAAGFILVRNPTLVTALVTSFLAGNRTKTGR